MPGAGGAGGGAEGAPNDGMGGGGGGAVGAPLLGSGGGGGGLPDIPFTGIGGGKGGAGGGDAKAVLRSEIGDAEYSGSSKAPGMVEGCDRTSGTGVEGLLSSWADRGRGGPIVPNKMLARCLALPPAGGSSSLSLSSFSLSALDHSSLSCRRRDCGPVSVGKMGFAASCWAIR